MFAGQNVDDLFQGFRFLVWDPGFGGWSAGFGGFGGNAGNEKGLRR